MCLNLIHFLVLIIFIEKCYECSPVYTFEMRNENNNIEEQDFIIGSELNNNSKDNTIIKLRAESKKKSCGEILIDTLPMICQHSANVFYTDNNYEYSGK